MKLATWRREWLKVSAGFLLEDEHFTSPDANHSDQNRHVPGMRAFQRRGSLEQLQGANMISPQMQRHLVVEYNRRLHAVESCLHEIIHAPQNHPMKILDIQNPALLDQVGFHNLDLILARIKSTHAELTKFVQYDEEGRERPPQQREVMQFQDVI